jgi:hypothetical protein
MGKRSNMDEVDYQQMLEDHGYKTEYKDLTAKVWVSGDCYGLGSFDPRDKNKQFNILAVELAKNGEAFSGWSKDVVIEVNGKYVTWEKVFGKERSDDG